MKKQIEKFIFPLAIAALIGFGVFFALDYFDINFPSKDNQQQEQQNADPDCIITPEQKTIRGDSMHPRFEADEEIIALTNFYDCNEVQRDDIVLISYPGNEKPLIKFIRGLPGDDYAFSEIGAETEKKHWHLSLNGETLQNSAGEPYVFNQETKKEIQKYQDVYGNSIPESRYLVMGDDPRGSMDSTQFGLMSKNTVIAKVVKDTNGSLKKMMEQSKEASE